MFAQRVEGALHIRVRGHPRFAFHLEALVIRQFEVGLGLEGRGELQPDTPAKLAFLNVGVADRPQFVLLERLFVGVRQQFLLHLLGDARRKRALHHGARRLAGSETGQARVFEKLLRHRLELGVHRRHVQFDAQQLLARSDIFHRYVHRVPFKFVPPARLLRADPVAGQ